MRAQRDEVREQAIKAQARHAAAEAERQAKETEVAAMKVTTAALAGCSLYALKAVHGP